MGKVYRVLDKKLNEEVALKLIKPEISSDKNTLKRFQNKLKIARKIGHRNVGLIPLLALGLYILLNGPKDSSVNLQFRDPEGNLKEAELKRNSKTMTAVPLSTGFWVTRSPSNTESSETVSSTSGCTVLGPIRSSRNSTMLLNA